MLQIRLERLLHGIEWNQKSAFNTDGSCPVTYKYPKGSRRRCAGVLLQPSGHSGDPLLAERCFLFLQ